MQIHGYGEFQQLRKSSQKDGAAIRGESSDRAERSEDEASGSSDAVTISPEARQKIKMRQASDFRADKVADVKARLEAGTLVTDDALRSGTGKMLNSLVSGDF